MELIKWDQRPQLSDPVMVAAFEGWNDAGEAATTALQYVIDACGAETFATVEAEDLYDFTITRPDVHFEGADRVIDWPSNELSAATLDSGRDVVFLLGVEPQLKWRTFCEQLTAAGQSLGVSMVLTLGALIADVPHTRSVPISGTTTDAGLGERLNLRSSTYEGPTGIVGVLNDNFRRVGVPTASLWASIPHYVSQNPSPKAALALVRRLDDFLGASIDTVELEIAASAYERQVNELVESDAEVAAYVRDLESQAEDDERNLQMLADAERFLRNQQSE